MCVICQQNEEDNNSYIKYINPEINVLDELSAVIDEIRNKYLDLIITSKNDAILFSFLFDKIEKYI
jgi:hypothetical protein